MTSIRIVYRPSTRATEEEESLSLRILHQRQYKLIYKGLSLLSKEGNEDSQCPVMYTENSERAEILSQISSKLDLQIQQFQEGERQRVKLANQLTNEGQAYVLDEPTTGLHGSDINKPLILFNQLVDNGNTVIIAEHNLDIISQADWVIDMGIGAGRNGGEIIFEGYPKDIIQNKISLTGNHLKDYISYL